MQVLIKVQEQVHKLHDLATIVSFTLRTKMEIVLPHIMELIIEYCLVVVGITHIKNMMVFLAVEAETAEVVQVEGLVKIQKNVTSIAQE